MIEQPATEARQIREQRGALHEPAPDRVRYGDVPRAQRLDQARNAEQRVGAELERIAKIVVHAPHDHVDLLQASERLQENAVVAHREIGAVDQREVEVLGEVRLLEVRRVRRARGEQHDARVVPVVRRQRLQGLTQRPEEQREPLDVALAEHVGEDARDDDAVLERVPAAGRRLGLVLEHAKLAALRADQIGAVDREPALPRDGHAVQRAQKFGCEKTISGGTNPSVRVR